MLTIVKGIPLVVLSLMFAIACEPVDDNASSTDLTAVPIPIVEIAQPTLSPTSTADIGATIDAAIKAAFPSPTAILAPDHSATVAAL